MYDFEKEASVRTGCFLLPAERCCGPVWPVVACDQYTSQPRYWEDLDGSTGEKPSTLRLILPECWLSEAAERVTRIHQTMADYLREGVLSRRVDGLILTERTIAAGKRRGLLLTVDLEKYDFAPDSASPVRPTEGTITERIPPRLRVREKAPLELSHVLLLADDPADSLIGPLYELRDELTQLYDMDLNGNGGHLKGWAVTDEKLLRDFFERVSALEKAGGGLSFAVGDGNHSLATARAHWLNVRQTLTDAEREVHPARYAMAELICLYDPALVFEPIHRCVFGTTPSEVLTALAAAAPVMDMDRPDVVLVHGKGDYPLRFTRPLHELPVGTLQQLLDKASFRLDYIHGEDAVRSLVREEGAVGLLLPAIDKYSLFPAVRKNGPLPRKCFSMGEANEKRYYLEARMIRG